MQSKLTKSQKIKTEWKEYKENGETFRIRANVRYDDECGNGHNSFSITGDIDRKAPNGRWVEHAGGCIHDDIAKHFPHLAPFIKWHLTSADEPMHYIANTVYHASNRDHNGLLPDEKRQIKDRATGIPAWHIVAIDKKTGEGKTRDFNAARSCAKWPEATDEQLSLPKAELEALLIARLPSLMQEFKQDMEKLGFKY